jgi:hypothetical protein
LENFILSSIILFIQSKKKKTVMSLRKWWIVILSLTIIQLNQCLVNGSLITQASYPPTELELISGRASFTKYDWAKVILNIYFRYQLPGESSSNSTNTTTPFPPPDPYFPQCERINGTGSTFNETIAALNVTFSNGSSIEVNGTSFPGCFVIPYQMYSSVFFPKVDYFAALKVSESYKSLIKYGDVLIEIEVNGVKSSQRIYRDPTRNGFFVGTFAASITIDEGSLMSIDWDSYNCELCNVSKTTGHRECMNGGDCVNEDSSDLATDLYIFLAWVGTDSISEPCQSLNYLPSKFQDFTVQPIFNSVYATAVSTFIP